MSSNNRAQSKRSNDDQVNEAKRRARRRLVGSIVLFLSAVTIVPAVIESEAPRQTEPVALVVPERPDAGRAIEGLEPNGQVSGSSPVEQSPADQTRVTESPPIERDDRPTSRVPNQEASSSATLSQGEKPAPPATTPESTRRSVPNESAVASPAPAEKPPVKPAKPQSTGPATPDSGFDPIAKFAQADVYWVQVAALSDKVRAEGLRDKLNQQGFQGRIESISTDSGMVHRVRVGPLAGQSEADSVQSRLKALGYTGRVVQ